MADEADSLTWTRRGFLRLSRSGGAAAWAATAINLDALTQAGTSVAHLSPEDAARDERYWKTVRSAFKLDRRLLNLNNGNSSPSPIPVHEAFTRHLDSCNVLPVHYRDRLKETLAPVRRQLAETFGCGPDEIAFMRNTTEALHAVQAGLTLAAGDEVLTTDQDYTLMLWAWEQRRRRDGIAVNRIQFPVPATAADLVSRIERAITPRTKVLHFCHVTGTTGQIFPVRELSRLARERGIFTIVDGAHAAGHIPFALRDLECDAYGTSLHKWLMAPHGTAFLYLRKDHIDRIWPLHAESPGMEGDIRKFEEIGTHAVAAWAAIADALAFHRAIGSERKAARLRYLTLRWARALQKHPRVTLLSSIERQQTFGIASFEIKGLRAQEVVRTLREKHGILVAAEENQGHPGPVFPHQAIRVTPQVYTSIEEIDAFVAAVNVLLTAA
jgi:isopenicillin-N epimerase